MADSLSQQRRADPAYIDARCYGHGEIESVAQDVLDDPRATDREVALALIIEGLLNEAYEASYGDDL